MTWSSLHDACSGGTASELFLSDGENRVLGMQWGGVAAAAAEPGGTGLAAAAVAACGGQRY